MTEEVILKVGLTPRHPCSYLGHEQEQLLVLMDHELLNAAGYERLLTAGFRRSGNDIYRPHCPACSACQSVASCASCCGDHSSAGGARSQSPSSISDDANHPFWGV